LDRIIVFFLVFLLLLSHVSTAKSQTNNYVYLPILYYPDPYSLDLEIRAESKSFYQSEYLINNPPPINWTGSHENCDPGDVNPTFQREVLRRVNYFRTMAGVPTVTFSEESSKYAQAAALVMSVNDTLNHFPPETFTCYSSEAYVGASSSNLHIGRYGWDAVTGLMKDHGDNNYRVGHRRWILYPQTQIMGTGNIPDTLTYRSSSALRVFDDHIWEARPETRDGFVAWPPPGYVPYPVVFPRWSFSYPNANFDNAMVVVLEGGNSLPVFQETVYYGPGEPTIVWLISGMDSYDDWPRPTHDTTYNIQINNVLNGGQLINFNYEVIVFDPNT